MSLAVTYLSGVVAGGVLAGGDDPGDDDAGGEAAGEVFVVVASSPSIIINAATTASTAAMATPISRFRLFCMHALVCGTKFGQKQSRPLSAGLTVRTVDSSSIRRRDSHDGVS